MASSSVSQDDVDLDFQISSRRSRIRTARARNINPPLPPPTAGEKCDESLDNGREGTDFTAQQEQDISPKPLNRSKDKRVNRNVLGSKGKQPPQRDRRKLREKRRSSGLVQIHSTESTEESTGIEEETSLNAEGYREKDADAVGEVEIASCSNRDKVPLVCSSLPDYRNKKIHHFRSKSPSDLEADDEDNQDYDSFNMSDSTLFCESSRLLRGLSLSSTATSEPPKLGLPSSSEALLEKIQEENARLLELLQEKDRMIASLKERLTKAHSLVGRLPPKVE